MSKKILFIYKCTHLLLLLLTSHSFFNPSSGALYTPSEHSSAGRSYYGQAHISHHSDRVLHRVSRISRSLDLGDRIVRGGSVEAVD